MLKTKRKEYRLYRCGLAAGYCGHYALYGSDKRPECPAVTLWDTDDSTGGNVNVFKYAKTKKQMERMSAEDLESLGDFPPQPYYYHTFYFTERYLCAPSAYALIRYDNIKNLTANSVKVSRAGQQSVYVKVEFSDGRPPVNINVKDYGTFQKEAAVFTAMIQHHQNRS